MQDDDGSINVVARCNGVDGHLLRKWMKQEEELKALREKVSGSRFRNTGAGRKFFHGDNTEKHLIDFVKERRNIALPVNVRMIVAEWQKFCPEELELLSSRAAAQRVYRMMDRHCLSFRRVTHQAQSTRTCTKTIKDWVEYIKKKALLIGVLPEGIANFDETNVYFSPKETYTIERRGERTVSVRSPDSNARLTAMIGVTRSGHQFPPFLIYKGAKSRGGRVLKEIATNEIAELNGYPSGMAYAVQKKAWMDEALMLEWVALVWKPYTKTIKGPTMLIIDEAPSHMTANVRLAIAECGSFLEYVPGGFTSKLQVMDVGLNKPFKDRIRECVNVFMVMNACGTKPSRQVVAKWVRDAWYDIRPTTIENTWKTIFEKEIN